MRASAPCAWPRSMRVRARLRGAAAARRSRPGLPVRKIIPRITQAGFRAVAPISSALAAPTSSRAAATTATRPSSAGCAAWWRRWISRASRWCVRTGADRSVCACSPRSRSALRPCSPQHTAAQLRAAAARRTRLAGHAHRELGGHGCGGLGSAGERHHRRGVPPPAYPRGAARLRCTLPGGRLQKRRARLSRTHSHPSRHGGHCREPQGVGAAGEVRDALHDRLQRCGSNDRAVGGGVPRACPGAAGQPHTTIRDAGHFLQEEQGEALASVLLELLRRATRLSAGAGPAGLQRAT